MAVSETGQANGYARGAGHAQGGNDAAGIGGLMMDIDLAIAKHKFNLQRHGAKQRGIEWKITFDEWITWWGADYHNRGTGRFQLQMQRFHDVGAYELGNIRKGIPKDNAKTRGAVMRRNNAAKLWLKHKQEVSLAPEEEAAEVDGLDEDAMEIWSMTGYRTSDYAKY
jgi:hypothetical protein